MKIEIGEYPEDDSPQKAEIHIDPWDTWSMYTTLAKIIHPMLVQLKETNHGIFFVPNEDLPEDLQTPENPLLMKIGSEGWNKKAYEWIMDEMIWTFNELKDENPNEPDISEYMKKGKPEDFIENSDSDSLHVHIFPGWKSETSEAEYKKHSSEYQKRVNRGTCLFGKYYQNLWD